MVPPGDVQRAANAITWFHSIDLGDGVVTTGASGPQLADDLFPPDGGQERPRHRRVGRVLLVPARTERGLRVVALDHYAWGVDIAARGAYWTECAAAGTLPDQSRDLTDFWRPELPGRRGFDFAAGVLGSAVEPVLADFATADLSELGTFDVVLYLGVLYHMKEPLTCLERLRSVMDEVAVIETQAVHLQHMEDESILQFYAGGELNHDYGNWYVPTLTGLHALCRAAGFSSVTTVQGPPSPPVPEPEPLRTRIGRRVGRIDRRDHLSASSTFYRAVVHAHV